jgi:hypothetical protein
VPSSRRIYASGQPRSFDDDVEMGYLLNNDGRLRGHRLHGQVGRVLNEGQQ